MRTLETQAPTDLPIYPIRTVARLAGVDARRIRAWESQYGLLRPARTRGGHRLFSQRDVDRIRRIRQLIDEEGLRLQGVRLLLEAESAADGGR
ncbi:MAG TPA: MerR family transcriptional regulator [bacterium]